MPSKPTPFTKKVFSKLLRSCSSKPKQLKEIHGLVLTTGLSIKNSLLTQLLENFVSLGHMTWARQLFDEMYKPRAFLCNVLIRGYVKNELPIETVSLYKRMREIGFSPDEFTYPFIVKALTELAEVSCAFAVHSHIIKHGLDSVPMVRTELIIMYVKFGELRLADFLFETMEDRDLLAWNAFIAVSVQIGNSAKALELYREMIADEVEFDAFTVSSLLSGCGQLGSLEIGEGIYDLAREKEVECNIIVENSRLDMYVKCGEVETARTLFDEMNHRNVVSWSSMILGYAMNGESEKALTSFNRMQNEGFRPNKVTYLGVLSACSHAGLMNEGKMYFDRMVRSKDRNFQPGKEHYSCMVDLLARSGHLDEAFDFIQSMPLEPDVGVWGALLGACVTHRDIGLGQKVADLILEMAPDTGSYHVLLSNIYAAAGKFDSVEKLRRKMRKHGVRKVAAFSSVEFDSHIHVFHGGDKTHPQSNAVYEKLEELLKRMKDFGYVPETSAVFHDVEMEEKEASLRHHSEKLAVAFGLINGGGGKTIRVIKNLRTCDDCHSFCKFASKITNRDIIMRDKSRFHHFRNGVCSCRDFW